MIVYRVQVQESNGEWITEWFAKKQEAKREARVAARRMKVHVDRVDVGKSRDEIVEALNAATANRCAAGAPAFEEIERN